MKKYVVIVLFALVVAVTFVGMGESANWKLSYMRPVESSAHRNLQAFAEQVEKGTNGKIKIDLFGSSALGDYTVVQERVGLGSVEMALQSIAITADRDLQIINLCYLVKDWDGVNKNFRRKDPLGQWISKRLEKQGIKFLGTYPLFFVGMVFTKEPPSPGDPNVPKNLKIRVPGMKVFELLGLSQNYMVTPLPYTEIFTALQSGMVDGAVGSGAEGYYTNFRDVIKYYVPANTNFEIWGHMMNLELFESLSPEEQKAVETAAADLEEKRFKTVQDEQKEYEQKLIDYGVKIIRLSPEELKALSDAAHEKVWSAMRNEVSKGIFDEFLSLIKE